MRIKLDENLPERLVVELERLGHDVETVRSEGLASHPDSDIWHAAESESRFLVTQDLAFGDRRRLRTPHSGVLLVRMGNAGREELFQRVVALFSNENVEDWNARLVVATPLKV